MEMIMRTRPDYSDLAKIKTEKQKRNERNRELIVEDIKQIEGLPAAVLKDITDFISRLENDPFDVNTLINYGVTTEEVAGRLSDIFI